MVLGGQIHVGPQLVRTVLHKRILEKIFLSKTERPISITLYANYPCVREVQVCLNKGTASHQRVDNHKNANIGWGHLKILVLRINDPNIKAS
jgi:hypothetical protein